MQLINTHHPQHNQILVQSRNNQPQLQFFCLGVLEYHIQERYTGSFDQTTKEGVVNLLSLDLLRTRHLDLEKFVVFKVANVLVQIAIREWPDDFPDFMTRHVYEAAMSDQFCIAGLVLMLTAGEMMAFGFLASDPRGKKIRADRIMRLEKQMKVEAPQFLNILSGVLKKQYAKEVSSPTTKQTQPGSTLRSKGSTLDIAFQLMDQVMTWVPIQANFTPALMEVVFQYVGIHQSKFSSSAVGCVNELLSRNFVPKDAEGFVLSVANFMRQILARIVADPSQVDSEYLGKFIHFTHVFLKHHLTRVEQHADFPMDQFLTDFYKFTFVQKDADSLLYALDVWGLFVDYIIDAELVLLDQGSTQTSARIGIYVQGLKALSEQLMEQVMWSRNSTMLGALEDSFGDHTEGEQALQPHDFEPNDVDKVDMVNKGDESDLDTLVHDTVVLVGKVAQLPLSSQSCMLPILTKTVDGLKEQLGVLSTPQHPGRLQAARDSCTYLRIVASITGYFPHPQRLEATFSGVSQIVQWCIDVAKFCASTRSNDAASTALHVQALDTLAAFRAWFRIAGMNRVQTMVSEALTQALAVLDTSISPFSTSTTHAGVKLVNVLATSVIPNFLQVPQVQPMVSSLGPFSISLPRSTQMRLYASLTTAVFVGMTRQENVLQTRLSQVQGLLRADVLEMLGLVPGDPKAMRLLAVLGASVLVVGREEGVHSGKQRVILHQVLECTALLGQVVQVLSSAMQGLMQTPVQPNAVKLAKACLEFLFRVIKVLRKELGNGLCQEVISSVVGLFSRGPELVERLLNMSGGLSLLHHLFQLFDALLSEASNVFNQSIPGILSVVTAYKELSGLGEEIVNILRLVLVKHWSWFVVSETNANTAIAGRIAHMGRVSKESFRL